MGLAGRDLMMMLDLKAMRLGYDGIIDLERFYDLGVCRRSLQRWLGGHTAPDVDAMDRVLRVIDMIELSGERRVGVRES